MYINQCVCVCLCEGRLDSNCFSIILIVIHLVKS